MKSVSTTFVHYILVFNIDSVIVALYFLQNEDLNKVDVPEQ